MQKLVYVPPGYKYKDGVVLTAAEPFIMSTVKGLGGVETSILSSTVVGMNGSYYQGNRTEPRVIPCTVYVHGKIAEICMSNAAAL